MEDIPRRWFPPLAHSKLCNGLERIWKALRRPFVGGTIWPSDVDGGSGKREKCSEEPVDDSMGSESFKRSMLAMDRSVLTSDGREGRGGCVVMGAGEGTSERVRDSWKPMLSTRSCAADAEGLSLLGVIAPFNSAVISSPLADGPADTNWDPFCDLLSVDVVP